MGKTTDAWFIVDSDAAPREPGSDGSDTYDETPARVRGVLVVLSIGAFVFVAFLGLLALSAPASGVTAAVVSAPTTVLASPESAPPAPAPQATVAASRTQTAIAPNHHRRR
jgi:hypothetical protein